MVMILHFPVPAISVQITDSGVPVLGQNGYSLTCNVSGTENLNPNITYQWTKNYGSRVQVDSATRILSFSPLKLSDAGQYTCQVTISSLYLRNDITVMNSQDIGIRRNLHA